MGFTIYLLPGIYSQLYSPLIPCYIGILFEERSFIAEFGMFVGIGEIVGKYFTVQTRIYTYTRIYYTRIYTYSHDIIPGGRLAGKLVAYLGFKKSSILVTLLGVLMFVLIAFMFPLFYSSAPIIYPNHWWNNVLGVAIGTK